MKIRPSIQILIPLVCLLLEATAQAIIPPPDGGYPGFTTAEGTKPLQNLTNGVANSGLGWYSLFRIVLPVTIRVSAQRRSC